MDFISPERLFIIVILSLLTGAALGQYWRARWIRRNRNRIRREAREILKDANRSRQAKLVEAELEAQQLLLEEQRSFQAFVERTKADLWRREETLTKRTEAVHKQEERASTALLEAEQRAAELASLRESLIKQESELHSRLARIAELSRDEAEAKLLELLQQQGKEQANRVVKRAYDERAEDLEKAVQDMIVSVMERLTEDIVSERSGVLLPLDSEDLRGRIIGRDGRNIRAFEAISGVDVLLDELPDHVMLCSHDPFRREAAKQAMIELLEDGRIQPTRIKAAIELAEQRLQGEAHRHAEEAFTKLKLPSASQEVLAVLGKLYFRTSFGQNVLLHCIEAASAAGLCAAELQLSPELQETAKRATLLHDVGKVLDEKSYPGPHALAGAEFLREHGETEIVANAVAAHHREVKDGSLIAALVRIADKISGGRPGARREDVQAYVKRLEDLEAIARSFSGVLNAYALRAGKEIHILVDSEKISDGEAILLAENIARQIEQGLPARGVVDISVVRETRAFSQANWKTIHESHA